MNRDTADVDKPPLDTVIATTRGQGLTGFYLSAPLLNYLKVFPRCCKIRTAYDASWVDADRIGLDDELSRACFQDGKLPKFGHVPETNDPIAKGFQANIPLCASHWVLRRFMDAPQYCLVSQSKFRLTVELRPRGAAPLSSAICLRQAALSLWIYESGVECTQGRS